MRTALRALCIFIATFASSAFCLDDGVLKKLIEAQLVAENVQGGSARENAIQKFEKVKQSTDDKLGQLIADYWIGRLIFQKTEKETYDPWPRFKEHMERVQKIYSDFPDDWRMAYLQIRLHDFQMTKEEDADRKFLTEFLSTGIKKFANNDYAGMLEDVAFAQLCSLETIVMRGKGHPESDGLQALLISLKAAGASPRILAKLEEQLAARLKAEEVTKNTPPKPPPIIPQPPVTPPVIAQPPVDSAPVRPGPVVEKKLENKNPVSQEVANPNPSLVNAPQSEFKAGPSLTVLVLIGIAGVSFLIVIVWAFRNRYSG